MTLFVSKDQKDSTQDQTHQEMGQSVESKVFMGTKPVLKNWKFSTAEGPANEPDEEAQTEISGDEEGNDTAEPAPVYKSNRSYTARKIKIAGPVAPIWLQLGQALAVFLTVAWITYAAIYIMALPGSVKAITSSPLTLGGVLASVLAPVAMLWLCIATWQRRSDAHIYAQALKEELRGMLFPDEEQSKLISDDIHLLMRQASEMSASSRAAVKAIQRARAGLRTEIRDFAGVSQKAEFHIDRLADSLGKRAEELLSLTETIEGQTTMISQKAGQGIQAWENVSAEISELSDEINTLFTSGAEKISKAGSNAREQVSAIENGLGAAALDLSSRMDEIAAQIQSAQTQMGADTGRLEAVAVSISDGAERLDESLKGAERISSAVEGVIQVMEGSLEKVETTSKSLFERTDHIEQKLSERAENLANSAKDLLGSTAELEKVGDLASHKLGEALTMALSGADTITASVRKSKELIDKAVAEASGQIESSGRAVEERIDRIIVTTRTNNDEISALLETMDEKNIKLENATISFSEQRQRTVSEIGVASEILQQAASEMAERAEEPVALLAQSVDRLSEQTKDLDDRLSIRIVELEQSRNKLNESMTTMSSSLKSNLQDVANVTGQLASHSKQIGDHVEHQKAGLVDLVDELESRTAEIAELLKAQTLELTDSLTVSETQIGLLGQSLFDRGDNLLDHVTTVADNVLRIESRIVEAMDTIDAKTSAASTALHNNTERLSDLADRVSPDCDRLIEAAEALEAKYAALRENYVTSSEMAVTCMTDIGRQLDERLEKLNAGVMEGSKSMLGMSEDLGQSMIEIRQVAEDAQDSLSRVQTGVTGRIDDLQLVTDQVKAKVETLQKNLDSYMGDISEIVGKATGDLQEATNLFGQSTELLDSKVEESTRKLEDSAKVYMEEGQRMSLFAEQATHKTARIVSAVREETGRLVESVQQSLVDLQKSGETLAVRSQEIETYMRSSMTNAETYGEELRKQAVEISSSSIEVVDQIADATTRLTTRIGEVRQAGSLVMESMDLSRQKLSDESNRMATITRKAVEAAEEAANVFARNSATLYRSVQDIAEQAKKLKDTQLRSERESFLAASKFIIESLYSLAVDVSRHLEDEIDARVLRAYQRGDVAAFAHHLVEMSNKIPLEKSQKKFIEDSEFRTYILRFIRQYEEILEQSQANDYGELLASLFHTSDVGKLYKILCEIAGRSAKTH